MNVFILSFLLTCIIFGTQGESPEASAKLDKIQDECLKEIGVTEESGVEVPEQTKQAFSLCFAKKLGVCDANGDVLVDKLKANLKKKYDENKVNELIAKCHVKKNSPEETVHSLIKCITKTA